jgi:DNA-binding response OmpR family regulator
MAKIIIVEDNESIRESVSSYLELDGHTVYSFERIEGVFDAVRHKEIDLLILDIMLPDGNGLVLAKKIRTEYDTPIIMLTAKVSESDRITGFEVGADDYIVKPFSVKELVLRVKSVLKRTGGDKKRNNYQFKLNDLIMKIDENTHRVLINEKEVHLTQAEWEILNYLVLNNNMLLDRSKILGESLDYLAEGSERTIDTHIKSIRKKLLSPDWIETIRGYGYKFIGESL